MDASSSEVTLAWVRLTENPTQRGPVRFTWSFSQSTILGNFFELKQRLLGVMTWHKETKSACSQREGVPQSVLSPTHPQQATLSQLTSLSLPSHLMADVGTVHCPRLAKEKPISPLLASSYLQRGFLELTCVSEGRGPERSFFRGIIGPCSSIITQKQSFVEGESGVVEMQRPKPARVLTEYPKRTRRGCC